MKHLIFLSLGLLLLAISFRSCAWTASESTQLDKPLAPSEVVRRHFPSSKKHNTYPMAQESFSPALFAIKEAALAQLPQLATIQADSKGNAHYPPPSLLDGLETSGQMVDYARSGGEKALVAAKYFEECANSDTAATAVRAVCVRHLWDLNGTAETVEVLEAVPYRIKKIAGQLPSAIKRPR